MLDGSYRLVILLRFLSMLMTRLRTVRMRFSARKLSGWMKPDPAERPLS